MPKQLPLIDGMPIRDLEEECDSKKESMNRVARNANPDYTLAAFRIVGDVASLMPEFTSDHIAEAIDSLPIPQRPYTHDRRALGPVMMRAAREGIITATGRIQKSNRSKLHNSPRQIWKSNIYRPIPVSREVAA